MVPDGHLGVDDGAEAERKEEAAVAAAVPLGDGGEVGVDGELAEAGPADRVSAVEAAAVVAAHVVVVVVVAGAVVVGVACEEVAAAADRPGADDDLVASSGSVAAELNPGQAPLVRLRSGP